MSVDSRPLVQKHTSLLHNDKTTTLSPHVCPRPHLQAFIIRHSLFYIRYSSYPSSPSAPWPCFLLFQVNRLFCSNFSPLLVGTIRQKESLSPLRRCKLKAEGGAVRLCELAQVKKKRLQFEEDFDIIVASKGLVA